MLVVNSAAGGGFRIAVPPPVAGRPPVSRHPDRTIQADHAALPPAVTPRPDLIAIRVVMAARIAIKAPGRDPGGLFPTPPQSPKPGISLPWGAVPGLGVLFRALFATSNTPNGGCPECLNPGFGH
jgi:hypothetical protein